MVVVVVIAGGALIALKAYNSKKERDQPGLEKVLFSIKQQAGVMAVLCTAVFGIISALQSARLQFGTSPASTPVQFGKRGGRIIDAVDDAMAST